MKLDSVRSVRVPLRVVLGGAEWTLDQLSEMGEGTIIELDRLAGEPVDLLAAGELVAQGEVVVIDENFGLRITRLVRQTPED